MNEITTLGRYRLETVLRKTQQADLYRAVDTVVNRTVTLRAFKPEWLTDQRVRNRLYQTLQRSAELVHPHIAWVWDIGDEEGRIFAAERYVDAGMLENTLQLEHRLSWEKAFPLFRHIAQALEFTHERGIIHGDLQFNQIYLSQEHGAIVEGFGLRQVFYPDLSVSRQIDQEAAARVLIGLLTGETAASGESIIPTSWPLGVPRLIEVALRRALGIHPAGPFSSMNEFLQAVQELASRPQPPLSPEELNLLQAEDLALQETREAERKAAEELGRQNALNAARREINEQFQKAMDDRSLLEKPELDETVSQEDVDTGDMGATIAESQPGIKGIAEPGDVVQPTEKISPSASQLDIISENTPSAAPKNKVRWRKITGFLIFLIIILAISGLVWIWLNGGFEQYFRI